MHINFFGRNIENGILLPVYVLKVNLYEDVDVESDIDELAFLIIQLLKKGEKVDAKNICRKIGIPIKYEKLIFHEINELKDKNIIKLNSEEVLVNDIKFNKPKSSVFYTLYDRINRSVMEVLIPEKYFEIFYGKIKGFNENKFYKLKAEKTYLESYSISKDIQNIIFKFNKIIEGYYENTLDNDLLEDDEIKNFIKTGFFPKNKLTFNYLENIETRVEADLVIKAIIDENSDVAYEWPFTFDRKSLYMDKFLWGNIDKKKLKNILNINDFISLEQCAKEAKDLNEKYKLLDNDIERRALFNQAAYFNKVLELNEDLYKSLQTPICVYDKITKSILNNCIEKFGNVNRSEKNISLRKLMSYENDKVEKLKKYTIFSSIYNTNIKTVREGFKLSRSISTNSISDCVQAIYLAPFLVKDDFSNRIFDLLVSDDRIMNFLNKVWLYRNNTQHNIEKGKFYNKEFDMEKKYKERQLEEYNILIEDLFYFIKKIKEL